MHSGGTQNRIFDFFKRPKWLLAVFFVKFWSFKVESWRPLDFEGVPKINGIRIESEETQKYTVWNEKVQRSVCTRYVTAGTTYQYFLPSVASSAHLSIRASDAVLIPGVKHTRAFSRTLEWIREAIGSHLPITPIFRLYRNAYHFSCFLGSITEGHKFRS